MSNTEQLRALRDAAFYETSEIRFPLERMCDRAIAALEAEGPKACLCGDPTNSDGWVHSPHGCHHSAAQQPARTAVPPLYTSCSLGEARMHAVATAIAAGRDAALDRAEKAERERDEARALAWEQAERVLQEWDGAAYWSALHTAEVERSIATRKEVLALKKHNQSVILRYGPFDKDIEALAKRLYIECGRNRKSADEASAELAAERESHAKTLDKLADYSARVESLSAELAAIKSQEPVGYYSTLWVGDIRWINGYPGGKLSPSQRLYAAPVASIPLAQHETECRRLQEAEAAAMALVVSHEGRIAQHEAALAEARRDERERCAGIAEAFRIEAERRSYSACSQVAASLYRGDAFGYQKIRDAIRALRDGGEGGE